MDLLDELDVGNQGYLFGVTQVVNVLGDLVIVYQLPILAAILLGEPLGLAISVGQAWALCPLLITL